MSTLPVVSDLKDFARSEIPTADDSLYSSALNAAISEIRSGTQRHIHIAGATATARVFVPTSRTHLRIDDAVSITSVVNKGVTLTGYQTFPLNGLSPMGEYNPIEQIDLVNGDLFEYGDDNPLEATVTVTARWGWTAIPEAIRFAILILAKDILSNRDVRFGLVAVTEAAGIGVRTNTQVRTAVNAYRRPEAWGIG
jgi:hypothetical protein